MARITTYNRIILYARFSSDAQSEGKSLVRQFGDMEAWLKSEGLDILPQIRVTDEGASGFHGHHRSVGNLGRLEDEVKEGIHAGSLFLCEDLDRFTREGTDEGLQLLRDYTRAGVTVQTLDGDYHEAGKPSTLEDILRAAVKLERARNESESKAKRTASNWSIAQREAREHGRVPRRDIAPWIRVDKDRKPHLIKDRADLVLRMFRLSDEGKGEGKIARLFEQEGISTWSGRKNQAKVWQRTQIRKILDNRKVLGEWQPMKKEGHKLVPNGEPVIGLLPQVVPTELFNRVQVNRASRKSVGGGRRSKKLANLFSTKITCRDCGTHYSYSNGRREGTTFNNRGKRYIYKRDCGSLHCRTAAVSKGKKCKNTGYWGYLTFEDAVTEALLHLAMDDTAFANRGELGRVTETIANKERDLGIVMAKAERLWTVFAENGSDNARQLAEKVDEETSELKSSLEGLRRQREEASGRVSNAAHLARVEDIRGDLYCSDLSKRLEVRTKVAQALHSLIEVIEMDDERAFIRLRGGVGCLIVNRKGEIINGLDTFKDYRTSASELDDYKRRRRAAIEAGTSPFPQHKSAQARKG